MNKKSLQIGAWLAAMALALWIAVKFSSSAFPVAAVPFPLTRGEETSRMEDFLKAMGAPVAGYRSAVEFGESEDIQDFIERQFGSARLAEAARGGVNVWYWAGRWFKPEQHEEYRVSVDQNGYVVGYEHVIEEERALPLLTGSQARATAEDFLRLRITQHPVTGLKYLETRTDKKPHRTDYTILWERTALRMGDAPYQLAVTVQGNEVGGYVEYLKVPERWTVEFQRERAVNDLCYKMATFAAAVVMLGLAAAFVMAVRNHQVRWRDAVPWGWLVVIGVVGALTQINGLPDVLYGYATTEKWAPFVVGAVTSGIQSVIGEALLFWVVMLMADCIYRARLPGMSSFRRALGPMALRDRQTVRAMGVGIAFAVFALAYVGVFYTVGQRFGVWCPLDIDYSKTLSGPLPWIEAMHTGFSACFSEEMIFRVGELLLLWRILRVRWLAVVLAAATWGFLHSNYPQMPGYTRGIELTIVGIIWGTLMLRYGVVATLTAHYLYDCWLQSVITFQAAGWENKVGAVAVSVWPIGLFLWAVLRPGKELEPEAAHVRARPEVAAPPPREWLHVPLGVSRKGAAIIFAGSLAGLALVLFAPKPQGKITQLGKLDLSRAAIIARADETLRERGYSPDGYERVASVNAQGLPAEYLLEHGSLDRVAGLYETDFPDLCWTVRYFRFLQPEEFAVELDQHGKFLTWSHTVLRETPGAELGEADAMAKARAGMAEDWRIDVARQELAQDSPAQQEHRRDWGFAFDQKDFGWGDAKLRTAIVVQGSEAMSMRRYVKVPEAWALEHEKSGWRQLISSQIKFWSGLAMIAFLGALLTLLIRKHLAPWRKAFLYALFPLGLKLITQVNEGRQFYANYVNTSVPKANYLISEIGGRALGMTWGYLGAVFMIAVGLGFLHWAWGWTPGQVVVWPAERRERGLFWRDTLLVTFAGVVAMWLLGLVDIEMEGHFWPAETVTIAYWNVTEWAPWIGALMEAVQRGYDQVVRLAIAGSVLGLVWRRYPRLAWGLLLLLPLIDVEIPETAGRFAWGLVSAEASMLLTAYLALRVWRFNAVAVFLTYALSALSISLSLFLRKGGPVYQWQAAPLAGLIVLAVAIGWWVNRRPARSLPSA